MSRRETGGADACLPATLGRLPASAGSPGSVPRSTYTYTQAGGARTPQPAALPPLSLQPGGGYSWRTELQRQSLTVVVPGLGNWPGPSPPAMQAWETLAVPRAALQPGEHADLTTYLSTLVLRPACRLITFPFPTPPPNYLTCRANAPTATVSGGCIVQTDQKK